MEAGFRIDLKDWEEFGQTEKRNDDILENRNTITKGKKSGRCFNGKLRWSACLEEGWHKNVYGKSQ